MVLASSVVERGFDRIGGEMVLTSSVVERGFEPRSGQTIDYKIGICCFSAKHAAIRRFRERLVCSEGGLVQSGPHHHLIEIELTPDMI
jgi:hypothetical protein